MATVEFVGPSARDSDNIAASPSRLLNCYREPIVPGGRSGFALKSVLGLVDYAALPGIFITAMGVVDGVLYAVCEARLYRVDGVGAFTDLGPVASGPATIAGNNGLVTVCAGGRYWVWDGASLTEPTPGAFTDFGALDYIGNYTILTERNGRLFQWSNIADATDLPGLNFSTADGRDDNLVRPMQINGRLYLFKQGSHEIWYQTGGQGAEAFERLPGAIVDRGLKAFGLICRIPEGAFFVGDDNRAHLLTAGPQLVSTPPVETAIEQGEPLACVTYEDEGHTFCAIVFRDRPAWVYDIATGDWHERAEGVYQSAWSVAATARQGGVWYAGRSDGRVFRLGRSDTDAGVPLVREAVSRTLVQDGQRFVIYELELFPRKGFDNQSIALAVSRDGGITFGADKVRNMGPVGDYAGRVIWRALGQFRQANVRVRWSGDMTLNAEGRVKL